MKIKKIYLFRVTVTSVLFFMVMNTAATAQVVFSDDFGQTASRLTSPYMPAGSFTFGNPAGTVNEKAIENNHYAVVDPTHIVDAYPNSYYWFWTGPEPAGNTFGAANNPATTDHTGNSNGAVMVVNAGITLNDIYSRSVHLTAGSCYRFSVWLYLVNANSTIELRIRDVATQAILGSVSSGFISVEDTWQQFSFDFKVPADCTSTDVNALITNTFSTNGGNDYYIDDVVLEQLSTCTASQITCPFGVLPVQLINFNATVQNNCIGVVLNWSRASGQNGKHFIIERSANGQKWPAIATITATGNSSNINTYSYTDAAVSNGIWLYRLREQDIDGREKLSNTVSAKLSCGNSSYHIYPSRVYDVLTIQAPPGKMREVQVINDLGQLIKSLSINGSTTQTINTTNWCKGLYHVIVMENDLRVYTEKVFKQ